MELRPIFDRVVVLPQKPEEVTAFGLVLPATDNNLPICAEVVATGSGVSPDGKTVEMQVKVGDKVIFSKYAGVEYKLGEKSYVILRQTDILAVVENEK